MQQEHWVVARHFAGVLPFARFYGTSNCRQGSYGALFGSEHKLENEQDMCGLGRPTKAQSKFRTL